MRRRIPKWLVAGLALLVAVLAAGEDFGRQDDPPPVAAADIRVIDGDTIKINSLNYRLYGIDAPEKAQACRRDGIDWLCGQAAAAHLRQLVAGQAVACMEKDRDRYGRIVAVCRAGGQDLNRAMVAAGLAWAYTAYGRDYAAAEDDARRRKLGVWAAGTTATAPWDWRRERRENPAGPQTGIRAGIRG